MEAPDANGNAIEPWASDPGLCISWASIQGVSCSASGARRSYEDGSRDCANFLSVICQYLGRSAIIDTDSYIDSSPAAFRLERNPRRGPHANAPRGNTQTHRHPSCHSAPSQTGHLAHSRRRVPDLRSVEAADDLHAADNIRDMLGIG